MSSDSTATAAHRENLQGATWDLATEDEIRQGLEKAFDYRGDVTITRRDGSTISGYVFDRRASATLEHSVVRIIPAGSNKRISVSYSSIAGLAFTGRDTAAGKSWEAWMRKYQDKKAAGEKHIELKPESLEEE